MAHLSLLILGRREDAHEGLQLGRAAEGMPLAIPGRAPPSGWRLLPDARVQVGQIELGLRPPPERSLLLVPPPLMKPIRARGRRVTGVCLAGSVGIEAQHEHGQVLQVERSVVLPCAHFIGQRGK